MKKVLLTVLFLKFILFFNVTNAQMDQLITSTGQHQISADACGTVVSGEACPIIIEKSVGATTILKAYLYYSTGSLFYETDDPGEDVITLTGGGLVGEVVHGTNLTSSLALDGHHQYTRYEDVTDLLSPGLDAALDGTTTEYSILEHEDVTYHVQGVGIIVIWNNPTIENAIVHISIGSACTDVGVTESIEVDPIDTDLVGFYATLGVGLVYANGNLILDPVEPSISTLKINDAELYDSLGGFEDGAYITGAVITLGGFGDSEASIDDEYFDFSDFEAQIKVS